MNIGSKILPTSKTIVFLDMDNTICNLTKGVIRMWEDTYNTKAPFSPLEKQTGHWISGGDGKDRQLLELLFHTQGLFANLEPLPGALEAVRYLMEKHLVYFASRTDFLSPHAPQEKAIWLEKYLGRKAFDRAIFMVDKSVLYGHILIDDAPQIEGELKDEHIFEHVLFEQNYNTSIKNKRRINWSNWKEILPELM